MTRTLKPLSGRRAIVLGRISFVTHALEAPGFGLGIAGGIYLVARKAGEVVLLNRRGSPSGALVRPGVLLILGVVIVAASLLFFHRKRRVLYQRLLAAAVAIAFFAYGYASELRSVTMGTFFGLTTLTPSTSFVEDYPARPKVRYEVNRWGLRGADFAERPPEGASRVAIIGDSFVFGSGVEQDGTLSAQLEARLHERFPAAKLDVLNLGVPGNNLLSHLAMIRIAEAHLGASVTVLCLTLPNDLTAWDGQEERAAHQRIGTFSLASYLLGYSTAITIWGDRNLPRGVTPEGLAFFEDEMSRFAATRSSTSRPIVAFTYSFAEPRISRALASVPRVVAVPPDRFADDHFIPNDGHPTALGNQDFAKRIAAAFDPAWITAANPSR